MPDPATSRLTKVRAYEFDPRHLLPMVRDALELAVVRMANRRTRRYVVALGRNVRHWAFEARDRMPSIEPSEVTAFLGSTQLREIVLPPLEIIASAGLGFSSPYALLGTIASALQPSKVFETGTFRGVSALTIALNAPCARIFTLDLPQDSCEGDASSLSKGDREWVRLSRESTGVAFRGHPAESRIRQLRGNSLAFDATAVVGEADLCFIDGGHSYECVKADTENALKILTPTGVIVWDDYAWFVEGVRRYLTELARELPLRRIAGTQFVIYRRGS